jgi:hypothetical protein
MKMLHWSHNLRLSYFKWSTMQLLLDPGIGLGGSKITTHTWENKTMQGLQSQQETQLTWPSQLHVLRKVLCFPPYPLSTTELRGEFWVHRRSTSSVGEAWVPPPPSAAPGWWGGGFTTAMAGSHSGCRLSKDKIVRRWTSGTYKMMQRMQKSTPVPLQIKFDNMVWAETMPLPGSCYVFIYG